MPAYNSIRAWTFSAILVIFGVICLAGDAQQHYITSTFNIVQKIEIDYAISRERLAAQPDWSPTNRDIPLQPQQAAAIALKWYRARYPAVAKSISISSIGLQAIPLTDYRKWHYTVSSDFPDDAHPKLPDGVIYAVVLLDGTVVEPQVNPNPPRWMPRPPNPLPK